MIRPFPLLPAGTPGPAEAPTKQRMPLFIVPMLAGFAGLVMMALPGLSRHGGGHAHTSHAGHLAHGGHAGHLTQAGHAAHGVHVAKGAGHAGTGHAAPLKAGGQTHAVAHSGHAQVRHGGTSSSHSLLEILDPRLLFSVTALFGASGQIAVSLGLSAGWSALVAVPAAIGLEWAVVGRLWRLAMQFQGQPDSPLETILFDEVEAVTSFRNGKGMVRAVKDGRSVQLVAHLKEDVGDAVRTGDRLRVVEVNPDNERVMVTRI